jgi:hypothetical protein
LSLDSFWSIDSLFAMVSVRLVGVRPALLYLLPALIAVLAIVVAIALARGNRRGVAGWASMVVVVALLAFPSPDLAYVMLRSDWHVGTVLWCLLAFAGMSRGRFDWGWIVGGLFLAAGILGDFQIIVFGAIPLAIAGLCAMVRCRAWQAGVPSLLGAIYGVALAGVIRTIADAIGTFALAGAKPTAHASQIVANLHRVFTRSGALLGVGSAPVGRSNGATVWQFLHIFGVAAVVIGIVVGVVGLAVGLLRKQPDGAEASASWRLDDVLLLGLFADAAVFVLLALTGNGNYARQLTAGVIFGSILAGRAIGRVVDHFARHRALPLIGAAGLAITCCFVADFATDFSRPEPAQPATELAAYLSAHQLSQGIGDYWSASIVTVESRGKTAIRPVVMSPQGHLVRYQKQSAASWYQGVPFQFFVYNTARPWGHVNAAGAIATFGQPAATQSVGTYRILTWSHDLSVSINGATWY